MSKACQKFSTPVTGGNVSFYNQSIVAGKEVPAWEAMAHEDHTALEEAPGFTEFEAEEDYKKDLNTAFDVADLIIRGTPVMGEDADEMTAELAEILSGQDHMATVEAIREFIKGPSDEHHG